MKKINGGYQSFFEYLVRKNFPFARSIDTRLYPEEYATIKYSSTTPYDRRYNELPRGEWTDRFIGALQPIASMAHDIQYTFKPYKSSHDVLMDLAQPLRGLSNILRGVTNVITVPLFFLGNTIRYSLISGTWSYFSKNMHMNIARSSTWLIDGFSSIVRGSTQVIASPLTWTLRMPFKGILTAIKGTPDIIENEEIQHLVDLGQKALNKQDSYTMDCVRHRLHEEYEKSVYRGQHSKIAPEIEKNAFSLMYFKHPLHEDAKNASIAYLSLFRAVETDSVVDDPLPQKSNSL